MNKNGKIKYSSHIPKDEYIDGSRIYVENGEVKTDYSDEIKKKGYMSVEDGMNITIAAVRMIYELNGVL